MEDNYSTKEGKMNISKNLTFTKGCNCCDGAYNSLDVHFTGACDNKCAHCIDMRFFGKGVSKPDVKAIAETIIENSSGINDVLFLGGEPCLYLEELLECVKILKRETSLKLFVTTSVPKTCYDSRDTFITLIELLDGINLSVQHHDERIADKIRGTVSAYDRQAFYRSLPMAEKIRINLNIVKPYLYTKEDISNCLYHYNKMQFNSIKLSEIQHGSGIFVSFEDVFNVKMYSPYSHGCQGYIYTGDILPGIMTPILLKRSCFACEETLQATAGDMFKVISKFFSTKTNKYGVVYEDGTLENGWV